MIDEKKLIEELKENNFDILMTDGDCFGLGECTENVIELINKQPKVGEWIPCSERVPEDGKDVLVWFEYFRYGSYNRLFQMQGIGSMYNGKWSSVVNGTTGWKDLRIIAWQPLPEPYKGE